MALLPTHAMGQGTHEMSHPATMTNSKTMMAPLRKMTAVYILVSDEADFYIDMLQLSASCMRRYNPDLNICLVTDQTTVGFVNANPACRNTLDQIVVVDDPAIRPMKKTDRSRYIKTSLRRHLVGDFLYIDIDAFPVGSLSSLFNRTNSISMAHDQNVAPERFHFEDYESEIFKKMNWPLPREYFNSGVMLVKDDQTAHSFYDDWHALWNESRLTGNHKDQPPMHEVIRRKNYSVGTLPKEANLLISLRPRCFWGRPMVYHISTIFFKERSDTVFHVMVKSMRDQLNFDLNAVDSIARSRYPWTDRNLLWNIFYTKNFHMVPKALLRRLLSRLGSSA
jgi:Glycosyl transferase family 8